MEGNNEWVEIKKTPTPWVIYVYGCPCVRKGETETREQNGEINKKRRVKT